MSLNDPKWIKLRILMTSVGFVFLLGALLFRSYHLQIVDNVRVHNLAEKQYKTILPVEPKRGTIYDRNGKELAVDVQVSSIALHPHLIQNSEAIISQLATILKISPDRVRSKLQSKRKFEWLVRRIPNETGTTLEALKIKGISIVPEYKRFYPNKELAGQLLGAVGYDAKALGGLELALDSYLKANASPTVAEKDAKGRFYTSSSSQELYHDVTLTLDMNLQFIAEKYLHENAEKHKVKSGFAIVMDPKTGEVLAMANYPSLNPNAYWDYPQQVWKNHAVIDTYEPGSTFKTMVAAAALDTAGLKPNDIFYCEKGEYRIGKRVIHDHEAYGNLTFAEIMKVSSNIGITKIAQKIGKEAFHNTIVKLGFGSLTGIGLPGEEKGILRPAKNWSPIDHSNIAFGQGIAVTGLQMARAYAAFANRGILMKPLILSKVVSSQGEAVLENTPTQIGPVVSPATAAYLTKMLTGVTETGGTGTLAELPGYEVSGKTGTAQKVDPQTRKYATGQYVSSFIGYVPSDNPEFMIYVVYDTPQPVYYGGLVAAPVFKNIAKEALAYRGIPPAHLNQEKVLAQETLPTPAEAVPTQSLAARAYEDFDPLLVTRSSLDQKVAPDLRGLSMREVLKLFEAEEVKLKIKGSGVVVSQNPAPGVSIRDRDIFEVELAPPT